MVPDGATTPPQLKAFLTAAGNCFQVCAQLEAVRFCLPYHRAAHHSLHPLLQGTTQGPGRSPPALLPARGIVQTKGRV